MILLNETVKDIKKNEKLDILIFYDLIILYIYIYKDIYYYIYKYILRKKIIKNKNNKYPY
jgi:hypothetical protein